MKATIRWGLLWRSRNRLDGLKEYLMYDGRALPVLFVTRSDARAWAERQYGYIRHRADLRREPHGWMLPRPVRVSIAQYSSEMRAGGRAGREGGKAVIRNPIARHVCGYWRVSPLDPPFRVSFMPGDEVWCASLHLDWNWRGVHHWHCWFLPWWPTGGRKEARL